MRQLEKVMVKSNTDRSGICVKLFIPKDTEKTNLLLEGDICGTFIKRDFTLVHY
jgi:hypothetical protein